MVLKWPRKLVSASEERHVIILFSFNHSCQGDCVTVAAVKATERKQWPGGPRSWTKSWCKLSSLACHLC